MFRLPSVFVTLALLSASVMALSPVETIAQQDYQGQVDTVVTSLDAFWSNTLGAADVPYQTPTVIAVTTPSTSSCGPVDPSTTYAMYCPGDQAIYFSPGWFAQNQVGIGDFAWITVLAHEWGHHIQQLTGVVMTPGNAYELQADCLAGTFAEYAKQRGLLHQGDITEGVSISASAGDPI